MFPTAKLGPLATKVGSGATPRGGASVYTDDGVAFIRSQNVLDFRMKLDDVAHLTDDAAHALRGVTVEPDDVLLNITGDSIARCCVVEAEALPARVSQHVAIIRTTKDLHSRFLQYALLEPAFKRQLIAISDGGGTRKALTKAMIEGLEIPLPLFAEQQAIAEVLGALDDKIAENKLTAVLSDELAEAFYVRAVAGCSDTATVGATAVTVLGGTPSRSRPDFWTDGTVPWIASGKANEQRVLEPTEMITEEALTKSAAKMMPIGATVVAITGATLGQVARLEIATSGNQSLVGVWSADPATNDWLYFGIRHEIDELLKHATGAAQQHVNKAALDGLVIPWLEAATVKHWGGEVRPLLDAAAVADRESLVLARTRDELLPLLMSGKVRVKDAEKTLEGML